MAIIKVRTPTGIEQVRIAGKSPTKEEQQAIISKFFPEKAVTPTPEIDLTKATAEEIEQYKIALEQQGINPKTMKPFQAEDEMSLKDPGVDYMSGLQNFEFRRKLGARDTDEEKEVFLQEQVGTEGYRKDRGGRFILTKQGRSKIGLEDGPELAIDEESLSRYDFADFVGQSGVPLATGVGAGLLLSGTGFLVAGPAVGAAMGISKLLEEAYETTQGYQRQSQDEINRAAAMEAVFGLAGEGIGRGISKMFGRIFKGSASKQAEAARAEGRKLLDQNFKPTVEGAIPGVRPILNRLQSIYEGIFPNVKAADDNLDIVLKQLADLNIKKSSLESLETAVKRDINEMFGTADSRVREATRKLNKEIEADIKALIDPLKKGEKITDDAIQKYLSSKRVFEEEADSLFTKASKMLGENNKVVPITAVKMAFDKGVRTLPEAEKVADTQLARILQKAVDEDGGYVTPQDAQLIQKIVGNLSNSDEFRSTVKGGLQANLKRSIRESFSQAEQNINFLINNLRDVARFRKDPSSTEPFPVGTEEAANFIDKFLAKRVVTSTGKGVPQPNRALIEQLREGLSLLQRSQSFYASGMKRFSDPIVEKLFKETEAGTVPFDPSKFLPEVVQNNAPEQLKRYLKALRGAPTIQGLQTGEVTLARSQVSGPFGRKMSVKEAKQFVQTLPDNQTKKRMLSEIRFIETNQGKVRTARENARRQALEEGRFTSESARQSLARAWFQKEIDDPGNYTTRNGVESLDGIRLARKIEELGSTKDVLFRGELDSVKRLTTLLKQTGAEIDPRIMAQFGDEGIAAGIRSLRNSVENQTAFNQNSLLRSLQVNDTEGIAKQLFQRQNPDRIRAFRNGELQLRTADGRTVTTKEFGDIRPETIEAVQDASMGRIIRSLGDMDSPEFREKFVSGNLGSNLQTTLNGYGRETLTAMFGKQTADGLFKLSDNMIAVSNAPIAGKGGLAAPNIALGLGIYGLVTAPFATIPLAAFYLGMSKALRSPTVLKTLTSSRKPGGDAIGTTFQVMESSMAKAMLELGFSEEGFDVSPEARQSIDQAIQQTTGLFGEVAPQVKQAVSQLPAISPPSPASSVAAVNPMSLNPIVTPDPRDRALAEQLMNRSQ